MIFPKAIIALAAIAELVSAHPGQSAQDAKREMQKRSEYLASLENADIAHCAPKLAKRGDVDRTIERRRNVLRRLREERGLDPEGPHHIVPRQMDKVLAKSHKSSLKLPSTPFKADWALLGQNRSAILSPEQTEGPYYVAGEYVRKNIKDNEKGIDLFMDVQIVDINTCLPIPEVAMEVWSCNATGVYGGVNMAFGNGNGNDKTNIDKKALRGIQISNKDGAVQYETIIPGHYSGRTHHVHLMTHLNATVNPNKTISGGRVAHVGQLYLDQDLVDEVEKYPPYVDNKQEWMRNAQDWTMASGVTGGSDPVMEYVLLGKDVRDGVFAWINFGIDTKTSKQVMAATTCTESGCKASGMFAFLAGASDSTVSATFQNALGALGVALGLRPSPPTPPKGP